VKPDSEEALRKLLKEMKDAHAFIKFWLRGSPIDKTLDTWIAIIEQVLKHEEAPKLQATSYTSTAGAVVP